MGAAKRRKGDRERWEARETYNALREGELPALIARGLWVANNPWNLDRPH